MAEADDVADTAGAFLEIVANDEEQAALAADSDGLELVAQYLPQDIAELREMIEFAGPSPTAPSVLAAVTAPTLLLHGSRTTREWFTDGVRYAAQHIADAHVREVADAGHLGPAIAPAAIAAELTRFLATAPRLV